MKGFEMKIIKSVLTKSRHPDFEEIRYAIAEVRGVGKMQIAANEEGICWLGMTENLSRLKKEFPAAKLKRDDRLKKHARDIADIWRRKKKTLSLPLVLTGTGFQILVWSELLKIKSGDTFTYQDIAKKIGKPKAIRAVGSAVGANPLTLLVPCHRVLSKTGTKLKFGWGPEAKRKLLKAEGVEI